MVFNDPSLRSGYGSSANDKLVHMIYEDGHLLTPRSTAGILPLAGRVVSKDDITGFHL